MVKKTSTSIMVPKSNKKPISEEKKVEKQPKTEVSQGEVAKTEKVEESIIKFDSSKLLYQFYDPTKVLPEQYHAEIPENKNVFFIPLKLLFGINEENYNNILAKGSGYIYARYEEVVLQPNLELDIIKDFIRYIMDKGKHVVLLIDDPKVNETNKQLAIDLIKRTLYRFRISYSDIINTGIQDIMYFHEKGTCSYVSLIPVRTDEVTVKFIGYSVNINLSNSETK